MSTGIDIMITPANVLTGVLIIWTIFVTFTNLSNKQERTELEKNYQDLINQVKQELTKAITDLKHDIDIRFDKNEQSILEKECSLEKKIIRIESILSLSDLKEKIDILEIKLDQQNDTD